MQQDEEGEGSMGTETQAPSPQLSWWESQGQRDRSRRRQLGAVILESVGSGQRSREMEKEEGIWGFENQEAKVKDIQWENKFLVFELIQFEI